MTTLRDRLRSGDIWVEGSRAFRAFDNFLLPPKIFAARQRNDELGLAVSSRGDHNRLDFAPQLSTVRYLGTFLDDPIAVPSSVLQPLSHQLAIHTLDGLLMTV